MNSWWIATADGGVMVFDTLRTLTDARQAVARLCALGRPVRAILVTHPHPDHVTGLGTFKAAFPAAPVYGTREGDKWLAAHGREILTMNVRARAPGDATDEIPASDRFVRDGETLMVGRTRVDVTFLGEGESPADVAYFVLPLRPRYGQRLYKRDQE